MHEDTDQLIRNARQVLDSAAEITDDALVAPNAAALAGSAACLFDLEPSDANRAALRRYLRLAADYASNSGNHAVARECLERLAGCWAPLEREHYQCLERAGAACLVSGSFAEARDLLQRATALAAAAGDQECELAMHVQLVQALSRTGSPGQALELLQTSIPRARALRQPALQARLTAALAATNLVVGQVPAARDLAQQAERIAAGAGDTETALSAAGTYAATLALAGEHAASVACLREIAERAGAAGLQRMRSRTLGSLGVTLLEAGDVHGGRVVLEQAQELFVQLGDRNVQAHTCMNIGAALCEEGLHKKALRYLQQALGEFRHQGDEHSAHIAGINLAACMVALGRLEEAESLLHSESAAAQLAELEMKSAWHEVSGALALARGNPARAHELYYATLEPAREGGVQIYVAKAAMGCALAAVATGQWQVALNFALEAVHSLDKAGQAPQLDLVEALVLASRAARALGNRKASACHLTRALELADELPLLAKCEGPRARGLIAELRELEAAAPV